jgi:integrase
LNARPGASSQARGTTFDQFAGHYLAFLQSKKLKDLDRPTTIVKKHLVPVFGSLPLVSLTLNHGLRYLEQRRSEHAAEGTIERDCMVLLGMLNHAVALDVLDKNRLALLPVPEGTRRERVAEPWELWRILRMNSTAIGRMLLAGLQVPLRESKLIQTHREWLIQRADGYWIVPAPGSRLACRSLFRSIRLHSSCSTGNSHASPADFSNSGGMEIPSNIGGSMPANVLASRILHYHDLRHTTLSWLIEAGVDYPVVQRLAGHKIPGMTESYLHLWESSLREAVTVLERVTIEKLQAAMQDERGVVQLSNEGYADGRRAVVGSSWAVRKVTAACNSAEEWCRGTELNCRHQPFQGCALPTELPRHGSR